VLSATTTSDSERARWDTIPSHRQIDGNRTGHITQVGDASVHPGNRANEPAIESGLSVPRDMPFVAPDAFGHTNQTGDDRC